MTEMRSKQSFDQEPYGEREPVKHNARRKMRTWKIDGDRDNDRADDGRMRNATVRTITSPILN